MLEACGLSYDDIKVWGGSVEHTDFDTITNSIKDGRCDVFIQALSKGHPTFTELAVLGKIDLIGVSKASLKAMSKYRIIRIPAAEEQLQRTGAGSHSPQNHAYSNRQNG